MEYFEEKLIHLSMKHFTIKNLKVVLLLVLFMFGFSFLYSGMAQLPAFPGAVGFGSQTVGGRGGAVIEVTNLNNTGTGSLRAACEASGARIVVFRTGGIITLTSNIAIRNPYITIAGQTAPGGGICIKGGAISAATHDVVIRGLRFRVGDDAGGVLPYDNRDALIVDNDYDDVNNVVIDHCSLSWSIDELFSIWHPGAQNVTITHCILSEALYHSRHSKGLHPMGPLVGPGITNVSFIGNLLAHNRERNPRLQGGAAFINNVVYNRETKDVDIGDNAGIKKVSVIGNHFKKGPGAGSNIYSVSIRDDGMPAGSGVYVNDNIYSSYTTGNIYNSATWIVGTNPIPVSGYTAKPSSEVMDWVLDNAGATVPRDAVDTRIVNSVINGTGSFIDCVGTGEIIQHTGTATGSSSSSITLASNDAGNGGLIGYKITITSGTGSGQTRTITGYSYDTRVATVNSAWATPRPISGSGYKVYTDCSANAGGYPTYAAGTALADTDHDGMPDAWETSHGLNPNNAADRNGTGLSPEGYTNVEVYINSLIVSEESSPPLSEEITNVSTSTSKDADAYEGFAESGSSVYKDRTHTFGTIPTAYQNLDGIMGFCDDKTASASSTYYTFTLASAGTLYVLWDDRYSATTWMSTNGFTDTGDNITINTPTAVTMSVWYKSIASSGQQTLRGAGLSNGIMYVVLFEPGTIPTYPLTINSGSGDGNYASGTVVNISANAPPSGQQFSQWTGDVTNVADVHSSNTTITMPASATTVTATYSTSTVYQAENATIYLGNVEINQAGFNGTGFVDYNNVAGSYVQWTVNVASAGTYEIEIRYGNGTTVNRPMDIAVNGTLAIDELSFNSTTTWTNWTLRSFSVNLNSGNNTVRATATTSNGGPNVDQLEIVGPGIIIYEAEGGTLVSPIGSVADGSASGGYYIRTTTQFQGTATYTVNVPVAGDYKITGRVYATDGASDSYFVRVDQQTEVTYSINSMYYGSWNDVDVPGNFIGRQPYNCFPWTRSKYPVRLFLSD